MNAHALAHPGRPTVRIRGRQYPILLPSPRDPRLHLATVIISLQILGQVAFEFRLSIAQILVSLLTAAVLEVGIAFRRQHVIMWPASALLTGNGVAFILRVPGTEHGDWWSMNGWYIFAGVSAVSLLSKHLIRIHGRHVFNPSNFGLVLCFLLLGVEHAEPLDFWWAPMSGWMLLALVLIVAGGLAILTRLKLLGIAVMFWLAFAGGIGVLALSGHEMTARWHLGPVSGAYFWWVLVTSPELLVFLFFMITDPKTIPAGRVGRAVYAVGIGLLAALLIAPQTTEFASKVALLSALFIACMARGVFELAPGVAAWFKALVDARAHARAARHGRRGRRRGGGVRGPAPARGDSQPDGRGSGGHRGRRADGRPGAGRDDRPLDRRRFGDRAHDRDADRARCRRRPATPSPTRSAGATRRAQPRVRAARGCSRCSRRSAPLPRAGSRCRATASTASGSTSSPARARRRRPSSPSAAAPSRSRPTATRPRWPSRPRRRRRSCRRSTCSSTRGASASCARRHASIPSLATPAAPPAAPVVSARVSRAAANGFASVRLTDVAKQVGLDFRQGSFRYGVDAGDAPAMMGGGLCWLDYDNDGWMDLFAVNSYADAEIAELIDAAAGSRGARCSTTCEGAS